MRLKQFMFALAAMMLSFVSVNAQEGIVAKIGDSEYTTFANAMTDANAATGNVVVEVYDAVDFVDGMELKGSYTSITFTGKSDGAKITINQTAGGDYLEAHGKTVTFEDLNLAKANPMWSGNSGHMGNYFSIQGGTVTYTNCTFPNGACTSGGTATYNNCTFENSSEYGLWVYDDAIVTVNGGTIDSKKGIKVYSEDETTVTSTLTVQNATFTENVTEKPAVAVGYAESITLIGNTYNNTTAHVELDSGSDADCEGVTFVAKDADGNDIASELKMTDRSNSQAACGVLVDGKIYTTVTTAVAEIEEGSTATVTLLYASTETVELPEGVTLDKNGYTADGVTAENVTVKVPAVAKIGETSYATLAEAIAAVGAGDVVIELLDNVTLDYTAREAFGTAETTSVTINGNGNTLTLNQTNSDWSSFGLAAGKAVFNNMTIEKTGYGDTSGAWNTHAIIFSCPVEMNAVTVNNSMAVQAGAVLNNVTINEANGFYGLWVNGNGQTVTVNGGAINATNGGRGIKIADQYIDTPAQVTLNVTGTAFNTAKKAAVLVSSTAGAKIAASNVDITNVVADSQNMVWVDEDWAASYGAVEVTGATVSQEGVDSFPIVVKNGVKVVSYFKTLQEALDAAAAGSGEVTVEILEDIDLTSVTWNPVTVSAPGYPVVTVNGNSKTITGLTDMLFAGTWAGGSGLIINDLTIENSAIVNDKDDAKGTVGVGAFIGYPQANATITLSNCHLKNSSVEGGHWTGGLIGMAGGYNGNDGPVFMNLTIKDCSVTGSTITGKGSVGGVIGHGSCAAWTNVVIENTTVSGNTITSTGSSTNKAGAVMGTIGAAGQATTANGVTKTGGATVAATVENNNVTSNGTTITTIYGRQGTSTGMLYLNGGSYDNYPIEENVAYAAPVEGYLIAVNADGKYGLVEAPKGSNSPAYTKEVDGYVRVWGEGGGNAKESFELKLYSGETLIATTTLKNIDNIIDGDVYVTWNFYYPVSNDSYWATTWEAGHPNSAAQPTEVELYVDGTLVATTPAKMNGADDLNPVVWKELGGVAVASLEGEGTEASPYLINNKKELLWFQAKVDEQATDGSTQFAGKYFKMTADIDLEGVNWNPIGSMSGDHGSFKGVFDGDNHTISNLKVEQAGNGIGLFARTAGNAVIKNLKLNNVNVKSTDNSNYAGSVVGNAYASTKIENVHVSGNVLVSGRGYIGGIAGHGYVVMDNVSVVATGDGQGNDKGLVTSTFWCAGGILGYGGEGATNIMNANVENVVVTSAAGGLGAIVGMAEDNNGTQPISGSNLSAKNVEIKTYVGAYGTNYEDYAMGYLYGGNPTSELTGELSVENVTVETASGNTASVNDAVASVGTAIYFNLASAVAAAQAGETVTLLRDITGADITIGKAITLDLGGKTINDAYIKIAAAVTVKNGSIKNVDESYPLVVNSGTLTVEEVAIEASKSDRAIWVRGGASLVFNSGSILATKGENNTKTSLIAAIYTDTNTNVTINGGTITVDTPDNKAVAIYGNYNNANVTVNGGKISTSGKNYSYGIHVDGDITVNGGEIITNEKAYGYSSGITYGFNYALVSALGDVTITGGTITTKGHSGYAVSVGRSYQSNDQVVAISGGTFENVLSDADVANGHKAPVLVWEGSASTVTATVTNGNFSGYSANLLRKDNENTTLTVSGGTFDVEINDAVLAEGFMLQANENGTYVVVVDPAYGKVAMIGETYYETLAAALTAANDGETITFLQDITEDVTVAKNVTIDGAEKNYTGTMTVNSSLTVSIENVNFIKGSTTELKGNKGNLTIKDCNFDGDNKSIAYAITVKGAEKLTIENCTAKDYNNGMLYIPSAVASISVKNVTVENVQSAFNIAYSGNGTFENVTLKNTTYGLNAHNFGSRTFTLKGWNVENVTEPIRVQERDSAYVTFKFDGCNTIPTLPTSEYAKLIGATITGTNYYGSIPGMVEKAENGQTVQLISDITLDTNKDELASCDGYPSFAHVESKAVTVDLNGKAITADAHAADLSKMLIGVFSTDNGGMLTLVDSSAEGTGSVTLNANDAKVYSLICNYEDGCNITINGGTYVADKLHDCLVYSGGKSDALVTVNGGNFKLDNVGTGENGKPWIFNVLGAGDHHILVKGGTFNADINRQHWSNEVYVHREYYTVNNGDGTYTIKEGAVAYVGEGMLTGPYFVRKDVGYATLGEAFAAADDNDKVTLLKDITYTKETGVISGEYVDGLVYTGDRNFTVDFAGHTVTENGDINDYLVYLKNTGERDNEITFMNGTIAINGQSTATAWAAITVGSKSSTAKTTLNLNGMNVVNYNPNDAANQVIRGRNGATVNLNEGTVVTSDGTSYGVIAESTSTLNINEGAKVIQQNSGATAGNQVYTAVSGNGTINMYDGAVIESDNYGIHNTTSGNAEINIYGGTITAPVIVRAATNGGSGQSADVYISGGTFYGAMEEYTNAANIHVSGGVFDRAVAEEFCAENYAPCDNEDGTYGVYYAYVDEVTIVDGSYTEFVNETEKTVGTLTYERTFTSVNVWQALYVPFEIPVETLTELGYEVAYLYDVHNTVVAGEEIDPAAIESVHFVKVNKGTLRANYPYIIRPTADADLNLILELSDAKLYSTAASEMNSVESSTTTTRYIFAGTYTKANRATLTGSDDIPCFRINPEGVWKKMSATANLIPFRICMYIVNKDGSPVIISDEAAKSIRIHIVGEENEDGTTTIYDVYENADSNGMIFDLQGRRILEPQKGSMYIINGKKVIY